MLGHGRAGLPARIALGLEPSRAPSRLVFRIAASGELPAEGAVQLACCWESEPERPLGRLELAFAELSLAERWTPFVVDLGPLAAGRAVRLEIACEPAECSGRIQVTPGLRCFYAPGRRDR